MATLSWNGAAWVAAFSAQMREPHAPGYQTISPDQYVAWTHGDSPGLPANTTQPQFMAALDGRRFR
jgi:hypothetical protein